MRRIRNVEVETIVCTRPPKANANGWSFPRRIEDILRRELPVDQFLIPVN
jgi:hypothetical protein